MGREDDSPKWASQDAMVALDLHSSPCLARGGTAWRSLVAHNPPGDARMRQRHRHYCRSVPVNLDRIDSCSKQGSKTLTQVQVPQGSGGPR